MDINEQFKKLPKELQDQVGITFFDKITNTRQIMMLYMVIKQAQVVGNLDFICHCRTVICRSDPTRKHLWHFNEAFWHDDDCDCEVCEEDDIDISQDHELVPNRPGFRW